MELPTIPYSIKRLLTLSAILIFIGTFTIVVFGQSIKKNNQEIKTLNTFLASAGNLQTNFERSLQLYVEETREITKFLLSIRPATEERYIQFISTIEQIGKDLFLDLNLQYIQPPKDAKEAIDNKTLDYQISFLGTNTELMKFLAELEKLPSYVKIQKIDFSNPALITKEEILQNGNINITISVFIK